MVRGNLKDHAGMVFHAECRRACSTPGACCDRCIQGAHAEKVENILDKITQLLTFLVCLVVIYVGFKYAAAGTSKLTPALRIPYSYAYAAIPVSFIPVAFFELRNFLADITGKGEHAAIEKPEEDLTGGQEFTL